MAIKLRPGSQQGLPHEYPRTPDEIGRNFKRVMDVLREMERKLQRVGVIGPEIAAGTIGLPEAAVPVAVVGRNTVFIDKADGALKIIFENGTIKTIATNV